MRLSDAQSVQIRACISLPAFPSGTNPKLRNITATPKLV